MQQKMGPRKYPLYRSADALEYAINEYFTLKDDQGKPPTMAGLSLALGFSSTRTLQQYEESGEEYATIVETARTRMEEWKNEVLLMGKVPAAGVIFDLKNNHSWKEKIDTTTTVEHSDTLTSLLNTLQGSTLRPDYSMDEVVLEDAEFIEVGYEDQMAPTMEVVATPAAAATTAETHANSRYQQPTLRPTDLSDYPDDLEPI